MPRLSPDAARSRELMLAVAADLFVERGYAATSIRDIAERLGVSKAAPYYHFDSKADLLDALVAPVLGRLGEHLRDSGELSTAEDRRAFLEGVVRIFADTSLTSAALLADPACVARLQEGLSREGLPVLVHDRLVRGLTGGRRSPAARLTASIRVAAAMAALRAGVTTCTRATDGEPISDALVRVVVGSASAALEEQ